MRRRALPSIQRTGFSSSGYRGGRQASSVEAGGRLGRSGQYINRRQRYYDVRRAFGLAGG